MAVDSVWAVNESFTKRKCREGEETWHKRARDLCRKEPELNAEEFPSSLMQLTPALEDMHS
jgi:hypothetical protein